MSDRVIELIDLEKSFSVGFFRKPVHAVRGISLEVREGEIFGLVGANGAGKTTTIKMMTSLIRPSGGEVKILGHDASDLRCRRALGYLPEVSHYYSYLTAAEILDFYARLYGLDGSVRRQRVGVLLERVGLGAQRVGSKRLSQFSKGMLQRLGLAQALIGDPRLVILDEPQSGLDPLGRRDVSDIIARCRDEGKTVFFSSHILPDVERICDRVALLKDGKLVRVGRVGELLGGEQQVEVRFAGVLEASAWAIFKEKFSLEAALFPSGGELRFLRQAQSVNDVISYLIGAGLEIEQVVERGGDLESLFVRLSRDEV